MARFLSIFVLILFFSNVLSDNSIFEERTFETFIAKYGKTYQKGSLEYRRGFTNFKANLQIQERLNTHRSDNSSAWYGINQFSDLSQKEFQDKYLSSYKPASHFVYPANFMQKWPPHVNTLISDLPQKVDWRKKKAVTPVKNQKDCGACWAFSIVEATESMVAISTKVLRPLSIQEVIDCSFGYHKWLSGCQGGDTCTGLEWLRTENVGLVPESAYPLTDKVGTCKVTVNETKGVHVSKYTCETLTNHSDIIRQHLATHGPLVVSVDATSWYNYQGGVIQYHCHNYKNHAVVIVGYDTTGDVPYYIVKNSWGTDFGHDGYLYIQIGGNICGIEEEVAQVYVAT